MPKCDACPVSGPCEGEVASRVCHLAAHRPDYRAKIVEHCARPGAAGAGFAGHGRPPEGVVQVWPLAFSGGAERAMVSVLRESRRFGVDWRGVAILNVSPPSGSSIVDELRSLGPVAIGDSEARAMVAGAKAVVSWAVPAIGLMLPADGVRRASIAVSHSPGQSHWAVECLGVTRGVDRWVAVSRSALAPVPERQRRSAVVIPNAIDPGRLRPTSGRDAVRAGWCVPASAKVLGSYARLSSEKDPMALARAVASLPPEWVGVHVGDGVERDSTREHAERIAPGRVRFLPARPDAGNVLMAFDALLVASRYESFCLTMAEGFAAGCPVIATPVGIAAEHPGLAEPIAFDDPGEGIARAVLAYDPSRRSRAKAVARRLWYPDRFGMAWADIIATEVARASQPPPIEPPDLIRRVNACSHRGCNTGCRHAICNRDHREVHIHECLACVRAEG